MSREKSNDSYLFFENFFFCFYLVRVHFEKTLKRSLTYQGSKEPILKRFDKFQALQRNLEAKKFQISSFLIMKITRRPTTRDFVNSRTMFQYAGSSTLCWLLAMRKGPTYVGTIEFCAMLCIKKLTALSVFVDHDNLKAVQKQTVVVCLHVCYAVNKWMCCPAEMYVIWLPFSLKSHHASNHRFQIWRGLWGLEKGGLLETGSFQKKIHFWDSR